MMKKLLAIFAFGSMLFAVPVLAHDQQMRDSLYSGWMENLQSKKGLCCTSNEGSTLKDVDWSPAKGLADSSGRSIECKVTPIESARPEIKPGQYCVRIDGTWWNVPDAAVIEESNKYGPAVVWPIWGSPHGGPKQIDGIRCFMPGAFT